MEDSPTNTKGKSKPALTIAPAGHVSLPEAEFVEMLEELAFLRRFRRSVLHSASPKLISIMAEAARLFGLDPVAVVGHSSDRKVTHAQLAIYLVARWELVDTYQIFTAIGRNPKIRARFETRANALFNSSPKFEAVVTKLGDLCS